MFDVSTNARPMLIAFASALVTLALIAIPSVTGSGSGADLSNPYYAFGVIALVACVLLSGAWLLLGYGR
jgi:hypothetical protein